ncbi:MAG: hypothetical protein ACE5JQ_01715 [Candidatus Methylomirabilales bacterium]
MRISVSATEREEIVEYLAGRFGVSPTALAGLRFLARGKNIWAVAEIAGVEEVLACFKVEAVGLPFLRKRGRFWKPTTAALLFLGDAIAKNVLDLAPEQLNRFLRGETLPGPFPVEAGYVVVRHAGKVLGCALYGKGGLKSQLPRAWVEALGTGIWQSGEEG